MKFFKKEQRQMKQKQNEAQTPFEEPASAGDSSEAETVGRVALAEDIQEHDDDLDGEISNKVCFTAAAKKPLSLFKRNKRRFLIYSGLALVFAAAAVTAIVLFNTDDTKAEVSYENVVVSTRTIDRTLTGAGEITYADTKTVSFSTSKTFTAMYVEEEDAVIDGEKLALYSDGTYLTADCNGVVSAISAPETGTVATDSNSITICPTDGVVLDITVPQDEIGIVAKGDSAEIIVNADTGTTYEGVITYIGGAAEDALSSSSSEDSGSSGSSSDSSGGSASPDAATSAGSSDSGSSGSDSTSYFEVIITVANDGNLKLGMSASCTIMLESKADVIAVPIAAVYFDGDTRYVNVVGSDGAVTKTTVETGVSDADYVEVTAGLSGDETVQVEKIG